ncbi:PilX N-terminal domain-containing pilus assembly protein [Pseudomonas sp.]|uniref:pilus assembly PilX family protein n=1 Tax=Pseudomonas sp. TaxID=306 RepID=UPI00289D25F8|nr:PilX N-terminal domain-containing pilus assembly protein [Pseudomonas sp.]
MKACLLVPHRQRGATLLIALIMLLLITLIATSSMHTTTLQTHVSGNVAERTRAFNAAESALREGERRLLDMSSKNETLFSSSSAGYASCSSSVTAIGSNLCILTEANDLSTTELALTWAGTALGASGTANQSVAYSGYDGNSSFSIEPRWVITAIPETSKTTTDVSATSQGKGVYYYRVTAAAKDSGNRIPVILQSIVKVEK